MQLALALSVLALTACGGQGGLDTAGKGQLSIVLGSTAAPAASMMRSPDHDGCDGLLGASVTFSSILARTLDGTLVDVTIALPAAVDMLALGNGQEATLPAGFLPPGTYDQLVVVMRSVELTLANGTKIAVTPPGGGWTAIVQVAQPFTVVEGETTTVTLELRRDLSFRCGLGHWEFQPRFECGGEG